MKRFSKQTLLTLQNLHDLPKTQYALYRIIDAFGKILFVGCAVESDLQYQIWSHRGRYHARQNLNYYFQYRTFKLKRDLKTIHKIEIEKMFRINLKRKK